MTHRRLVQCRGGRGDPQHMRGGWSNQEGFQRSPRITWTFLSVVVALLCLLGGPACVRGAQIYSDIGPVQGGVLLGSFCFTLADDDLGYVRGMVSTPQEGQWLFFTTNSDINGQDVGTCNFDKLSKLGTVGKAISFTGNDEQEGFTLELLGKHVDDTLNVWAVGCGGYETYLGYVIDFYNPGSLWVSQFSCENQGMLASFLAWTLIWWSSIAAASVARVRLHGVRRSDVLRTVMATALIMSVAITLNTVHLGLFALDGMGFVFSQWVGQFLDFCCQVSFTVGAVAIAQGWTISREVPDKDAALATLSVLLAGTYIAVLLQDIIVFDAKTEPNFVTALASGTGVVVALVKLAALILVLAAVHRNRKLEAARPRRRAVFTKFALLVAVCYFVDVTLLLALQTTGAQQWRAWQVWTSNILIATTWLYAFGTMFMLWPTTLRPIFDGELAQTGGTDDAVNATSSLISTAAPAPAAAGALKPSHFESDSAL